MIKQLGGKTLKKRSKKQSKKVINKYKLQKGGIPIPFKPKEIDLTKVTEYHDPIFNEKIRYDKKCEGDIAYFDKREIFANAMKDKDHPCNIGANGDKRIPTQEQLNKCDKERNAVMDEPCGEFNSKSTCMAGNAGQNMSAKIRRFRGEPLRIKNQHLKETDITQNYDQFGTTKVYKYCDQYKQKYCSDDHRPIDMTTGNELSGDWEKIQKIKFKCAKKQQTGVNNTCVNGWTGPGCKIHNKITDLVEPSNKAEEDKIKEQFNKYKETLLFNKVTPTEQQRQSYKPVTKFSMAPTTDLTNNSLFQRRLLSSKESQSGGSKSFNKRSKKSSKKGSKKSSKKSSKKGSKKGSKKSKKISRSSKV
jgi:hypothetical protein